MIQLKIFDDCLDAALEPEMYSKGEWEGTLRRLEVTDTWKHGRHLFFARRAKYVN